MPCTWLHEVLREPDLIQGFYTRLPWRGWIVSVVGTYSIIAFEKHQIVPTCTTWIDYLIAGDAVVL